jgi:PAS domain S-box-containing protein
MPSTEKEDQFNASEYAINLVNSSQDAVISEDLKGNIRSWNPAAERMFGYTKQEVLGKPLSIIAPKERKKEIDELLKKTIAGGDVQRYETVRKHKNGKPIRVSVTISAIKNSEGKVIGLLAIDRDVTKEKQNSQYARSLIEASVDPLVTISPDGKITDVNEASIQATGAPREELIGAIFSDYFTEPGKAEEGYKKVLKEGVVRDYPLTIKHKDGKLMDVLYNASVYKDVEGNVLGVFAAARDITEQKETSQYARSLIEASLDPLVTISPDGKITDVNEATIKATGVEREELIGTNFSEYFTEPQKAEEGYKQVLKEGSVQDYALTIKSRSSSSSSSSLMDVVYNASVYRDVRGKVIGIFAAARDVTKTKQASQYSRSLIEASVDPLVTISPNGKITDVNEATIQATGVGREELIGTNFSEYFTQPSQAEQGYQEVLKKGSVKDYPLTIRHKNGTQMEVSYNASVYKDTLGKVIGVFAAARDITATKRASQYSRSLIEASLDPLVTISADGKITDVNNATIEITGVPKRELIGSDFSLYFTEPEKAQSGYQEAFKAGEVRDYLLTIRSRLGKTTPVLYNASVYKDEKGKVIGVFAAAREIGRAELKAAQARELQRVSKSLVFKLLQSARISKGTIKLSDADAAKAGIDLVDNVVIRPTDKDASGKSLNVMSLTSSRLQDGVIIINPIDIRALGLENQDTVFITRSGVDIEPDFVEEEDIKPTPGLYDYEEQPIAEPSTKSTDKPSTKTKEKIEAKKQEVLQALDDPVESSSEESAVEEPAVEEPVAEEPAVEEPVAEEPAVEEPAVEEPVVEEPVAEEPAVEEPAVEEPVAEEPAVEEPIAEEPVAEEPVAEEPAVEEPIAEVPRDPVIDEDLDSTKKEPAEKVPSANKKPSNSKKTSKQKSFEAEIDKLRG